MISPRDQDTNQISKVIHCQLIGVHAQIGLQVVDIDHIQVQLPDSPAAKLFHLDGNTGEAHLYDKVSSTTTQNSWKLLERTLESWILEQAAKTTRRS